LCLPGIAFAGQDFDRGYALGYKEGYQKIADQFSIAPISPIPPIPGIDQDTFSAATTKASSTGLQQSLTGDIASLRTEMKRQP
jgi:hypothetical protein